MKFATALKHVHGALDELATHSAELENKNLSDIVAAARNKIGQALGHPDVEAVPEIGPKPDPEAPPLPFVPPAQ